MNPHFAAFSFVDRIAGLVPARRARGTFAVPAGLPGFPSCLVAEAIGQLAAWVAMAHLDFGGRPVAALARETRFHAKARPGETLELEVELSSCDDEAVAYSGSASVGARRLVELADSLGPILPVADFDDPAALRERFELLCGAGAPPGRFGGVELPALLRTRGERGHSLGGRLAVPAAAPFFADHFPRRPVFPATLLLQAQIGLALDLCTEAGMAAVPARLTNIKVRSFTLPGQVLDLYAEFLSREPRAAKIALSASAADKVVATTRLAVEPAPGKAFA